MMPCVFRPALGLVVLLSVCLALPARGQWVEPPGTGWAHLGVAHQNTGTKFDPDTGHRTPFDTEDARSITTTVRLTGALGLVRGVDAWIDVPYHRLAFNDVQADRLQTGVADPRLYVRAGPSLVGVEDLPVAVALRGGVKFPVGEFAPNADVIPLSEGQRDWDLLLEAGKSLHPWPVYVAGWVGYRWREANPTSTRKPGDERLVYLAAGGHVDRFRWKLAVDGLFGRPPTRTDLGLTLDNDRRALVQLIPTVGWRLGPGTLEAGACIPLRGRRVPAGPTGTLGYFLTWDESLW
jgi:hypothetical protein